MKLLQPSFRWYGPDDPVSLKDIRQTGATGIVTALHDIPNGAVWTVEDILGRKRLIEGAGMTWNVVESLPIHEDIKRRSGDYQTYIENYKLSIQNLALCGIHCITYNFMPIVDWTRTDLTYELGDGSLALRFDAIDFAAFDLYILERSGAQEEYTDEIKAIAKDRFNEMSDAMHSSLTANIIAGLPGSTVSGSDSLDGFKALIRTYDDIDYDTLQANLVYFLKKITTLTDHLGVRLAIHPDDPPFPLFGIPRIMSTTEDIRHIIDAIPNPSNGLCFCTGSYGVRKDNNLPAMIHLFGDRIHFLHLRATKRSPDGSFYEAAHLSGDVDMYAVMKALSKVQQERDYSIPMRPDHGHQILDDLNKQCNPGYSAIGRLKGLAELRGLEYAIIQSQKT